MKILISVVEYLMGIYMMLGGFSTALYSDAPYAGQYDLNGTLAHILSSEISLTIFGFIIFVVGFLLLYSKLRKDVTGIRLALYGIFFVNTFVLFLEILIFGVAPVEWIESFVMATLCVLFLIYRR